MIDLLLHYKYFILFPLSIFEGPILIVIAGSLSRTGVFNPWLAYFLVVLGDIVGDSLCYLLGRFGSRLLFSRVGRFFSITKEKLEQTRSYFAMHHSKAISMSKLIHGVGIAGLVTAGMLRISFTRYLKTTIPISFVQSAVLLIIGLVFGEAYLRIGKYLDYYMAIGIFVVVFILLYFGLKKFKLNLR